MKQSKAVEKQEKTEIIEKKDQTFRIKCYTISFYSSLVILIQILSESLVEMTLTQTGGVRNRVPTPGTDMTNIQSLEDFKQKMNFYAAIGHGIMAAREKEEGTVFIVPPKTYIFFITRAGIPGEKIKTGAIKEELEQFYYQNANASGNASETQEQWSQRIYNAMRDGTLLQNVLYKKETAFVEDKGYAIYEPGDLIQNLSIDFHNPTYPYMMLGIWKLPISRVTKKYLDGVNGRMEHFPQLIKDQLEQMKREGAKIMDETDKEIVLTKIVPYLGSMNRTTLEKETAFWDNPAINTIFIKYPTIESIRKEIYKIYYSISSVGDVERYFLSSPDNLLRQFPSISRKMSSTLYTILNESYSGNISPYKLPILSTKDLKGNDVYRFIVVDACRSLERDTPFEHTLRRSMSGYLRPEICMTSLLHLSKRGFESLPSLAKLKETSVIKKLLRGEEVKIADFEEELAPLKQANNTAVPYTFSDLLEYHKFSKGNTAYFFPKAYQFSPAQSLFPTMAKQGRIEGINTGEDGSIQYILQNTSGKQFKARALNVWPSEEVFVASAAKEERNMKKLKEAIQKAKEQKAEQEAAEKKAAENALAQQKRAEQERLAETARRKEEEEKAEAELKKTFVDLKNDIEELGEKQRLLRYGTVVQVKLSPPPKTGTIFERWQDRKGIVRKVMKTSKDGQEYLSVYIEPVTLGGEERLEGRFFKVDFVFPYEAPKKKGGRRATRVHRKTNKRTTRRLKKASKY